MASAGQQKRLRVRLKAPDPEGLARDFGALLRHDGLFLPCRERLAPKTPIRVQLLYSDGALAVEGRGRVVGYQHEPTPGLDLNLTWSEPSKALVQWCRGKAPRAAARTAPVDPKSLVADLLNPEISSSQTPVDAYESDGELDEDDVPDETLVDAPAVRVSPVVAMPDPPDSASDERPHSGTLEADPDGSSLTDLANAFAEATVVGLDAASLLSAAESPAPPADEEPVTDLPYESAPSADRSLGADRASSAVWTESADGPSGHSVVLPPWGDEVGRLESDSDVQPDSLGGANTSDAQLDSLGSANVSDAQPDSPGLASVPVDVDEHARSMGLRWMDEDEPLSEDTPPPGFVAPLAADFLEDEPLTGAAWRSDEAPPGGALPAMSLWASGSTTDGRSVAGGPDGTSDASASELTRPGPHSSVALRSSVPAKTSPTARQPTPPLGSPAQFVRQTVPKPEEAEEIDLSKPAGLPEVSTPPPPHDWVAESGIDPNGEAAPAPDPFVEAASARSSSPPLPDHRTPMPFEWDDDSPLEQDGLPMPDAEEILELVDDDLIEPIEDDEDATLVGRPRVVVPPAPSTGVLHGTATLPAERAAGDPMDSTVALPPPPSDFIDDAGPVFGAETPPERLTAETEAQTTDSPSPPSSDERPIPAPPWETEPPRLEILGGELGDDEEPWPNILPPLEFDGDALLVMPPPIGEADSELDLRGVVHLEEVVGQDTTTVDVPAVADTQYASVRPMIGLRIPTAEREPGEVTPLARIALVRKPYSEVFGTASVPPTAIPSKRNRPPLPDPSRTVIGVDLGTATTGTAAMLHGQPELVPSRRGTQVIPSVVLIEPSGKTFVGEAAARKLPWHPSLGIAGPGRLLGRVAGGPLARRWESEMTCDLVAGEESEVAACFGSHTVSIEEVVALLLKEVRESVSLRLSEGVNRAVITCPTFFGARQRQALRVAGELAGFHVERIVCAPLAAAVELTKGRIRPGRVIVVDCGAGALDVGLIEITPEGYELVAGRGSRTLGGDAYDQLLVGHLAKVTEGLKGAAGLGGFFDIREAAELGKWALSEQESTHIEVAHAGRDDGLDPGWHLSAEVRRSVAEELFEPLVSQSIELCKQLCEESGWDFDSIDSVVPVGGQARIPLLLNRLRDVFKGALTVLDPQNTIPFGAARVASRIAESRPLRLVERVPHDIAIGRRQGRLQRLLRQGDVLPAKAVHSVSVSSETDLDLFLFEGEGQMALKVEPLTRLTFTNLPSGIESPFTIRLEVEMSSEGVLRFDAVEPETGQVVEPMMNAELNTDTICRYLQISPGDEASLESSVFAWLLRRLSGAEFRRSDQR